MKLDRVLMRIAFVLGLGAGITTFHACSREPVSIVRATDPGYNGVARCAACHTGAYADWRKSLHSKAMAAPEDSTVVGDFSDVTYTYGGVTSRMYRDGQAFFMDTMGPEGRIEAYRVDYVVGVRQHQAYLTTFPDGRLQVLPLYHDGKLDRWVDAQEGSVVEGNAPLTPEDYYFWSNRGRAWNYHCYNCHASRVEKGYDPDTDHYSSTVGNLSIDCEACHGPGQKHDVTRGVPGVGLETPDLLAMPTDTQIEVCGRCHAAKQILNDDYEPTGSFYDSYLLYLPDIDEFYPDGQPQVYLYPMALHMMSPCYDQGGLVCTDCHDAHGSSFPVDLVANKNTSALCADCHPVEAADPTGHSHHKSTSPGNTCISCHMPTHHVTGEDMTDHRIVSPVPEATLAFGVPNSCNAKGCHADKSARWAADYARQWYGDYQTRAVARMQPFVDGRAGRRAAVEPLARVVADTSDMMVWRAVAAALLGPIGDGRAVPALLEGLKDAHPMVRVRSAVSLGQIGDARAIPRLLAALDDDIRPVRVYSAFALADLGFRPGADSTGILYHGAMSEHRAIVMGDQSDDPGMLASLGSVEERAGRYEAAAEIYARVGRLDPRHPETVSDLARIRSEIALRDRGLPALRAAVERSPESVWNRAFLGAFYLAHNDVRNAGIQLRTAADGIRSPGGYRLLGDALWAEGDAAGAAAAYGTALTLRGEDTAALRGLARTTFVRTDPDSLTAVNPGPPSTSAGEVAPEAVKLALAGRSVEAARAFARAMALESHALAAASVRAADVPGVTRAGALWRAARADSAFSLGVEAYAVRDTARARAAFSSAVRLDPEASRALFMLALLDVEAGDLDAALGAAREAILADPLFAEGFSTLGSVEAEAGDLPNARAHMESAAALDPETPLVVLSLAELYMNTGEFDRATSLTEGVLEREPRNEAARALHQEIKRRRTGS